MCVCVCVCVCMCMSEIENENNLEDTCVCVCKYARFEKRHQLYTKHYARVYHNNMYIHITRRTYAYGVCASGRGLKPPPDESLPKLLCRCTWTGETELALRTIYFIIRTTCAPSEY